MAAAKLLEISYRNPLREMHGVLRVGKTRVTLDTVIYAFQDGATAEEIVARYPTLTLEDVYATITLYLANREAVDLYLQLREKEREEIRRQNLELFNLAGLRERLLARKALLDQ